MFLWFYRVMPKIQRALISVSDKTALIPFASELHRLGVHLISTGGTADALRTANIPVEEVSDVTGFPEMLDGRVKTLHPKIHAGILAEDFESQDLKEYGIKPIDLVVVNLYPFEKTIAKREVTEEDAIENIDIGGVALIRAAAKNYKRVAVVVDPGDYSLLIQELSENGREVKEEVRRKLATKAYFRTASYDSIIANHLNSEPFSTFFLQPLKKVQDLRYGENPHQKASFYSSSGLQDFEQLQGKELSYNNYLDVHSAVELVQEFKDPACVVIKHTNPCGVGIDEASILQAFLRAKEADPVSYFGSIIAVNRSVDEGFAKALAPDFIEVIIAPSFDSEAKNIFSKKKNLRLLVQNCPPEPSFRHPEAPDRSRGQSAPKDPVSLEMRKVLNGYLVQEKSGAAQEKRNVVTKRKPTEEEEKSLEFVWKVVKHVKSNAIVVGSSNQIFGVGAGQMNRLNSVKLALSQAEGKGPCVLASDAFFPFRDNIDAISNSNVKAIIQPGGSVRDQEVIDACNEHNIAMIFTGTRYFTH